MKNIVHFLNADVFIHTWNTTGNTNKLILSLPRGFHLYLPFDFWHAPPDILSEERCQFEIELPSLFQHIQALAAGSDHVTDEEINDTYSPISYAIEPFDSDFFERQLRLEKMKEFFPDTTGLNAAPMFYKIRACDQLRQDHEIKTGKKYDRVIRVRPDLFFPDFFDLSDLILNERLYTLFNPFYEVTSISETHSNDMLFIGDSNTMTYATSIWDKLPEYWNPDCYPDWPITLRGPEAILNKHLRFAGLQGSVFKPTLLPYRVVQGMDYRILVNMLAADERRSRSLPSFIGDCVTACQSIHAVDLFYAGQKEEAQQILSVAVSFNSLVCPEPFAGRAKIASLMSDDGSILSDLLAKTREAGQVKTFPELFES